MKDTKVLIIGMGRSGRAAAKALIDKGAVVSIQDSKDSASFEPEFLEEMKAGGVTEYLGCVPEDMSAFDMLILSPGVPPTLGFIEDARKAGAEITRIPSRSSHFS